MTPRFSSPRNALIAYFAARRGPRAAKQRWGPRSSTRTYTGNDDTTWLTVGALLHGPAPLGCGVVLASDDEMMIWRWTEGLAERSPRIEYVERRLRELLREHSLMAPARRQRLVKIEDDGLVDGVGDSVQVELHRLEEIHDPSVV